MHGANFGYGCGGKCLADDSFKFANSLEGEAGEESPHILSSSKSTIGKIRHEVLEYDGADQKVYRLNEIDWQRAETDGGFDCTCMQKKGPKGKPACGAFEVTMCNHITHWNHTHIEFFVQQGVGAGLALQIGERHQTMHRCPCHSFSYNGITSRDVCRSVGQRVGRTLIHFG